VVKNFPFMGYFSEGVPFSYVSPELQPVNGHPVRVFVCNGWQNPHGSWHLKGEQRTDHTELSGHHPNYCFV
jgi:hypothetical protein